MQPRTSTCKNMHHIEHAAVDQVLGEGHQYLQGYGNVSGCHHRLHNACHCVLYSTHLEAGSGLGTIELRTQPADIVVRGVEALEILTS